MSKQNRPKLQRRPEPHPMWTVTDCKLRPNKMFAAFMRPVELKPGEMVSAIRPLPPQQGRARVECRYRDTMGWLFLDQLRAEPPEPAPETESAPAE